MSNTARVLYYVDMDDNHKSAFLVVDSSQDLRDIKVVEKIRDELEVCGFGRKGVCGSVAWELAHHETAELECQMGRYQFGIEDVPVMPLIG